MDSNEKVCQTEGCGKPSKLQCPICKKLGLEDSNFCSQECFKGFYSKHKVAHGGGDQAVDSKQPYNPWPNFRFSGKIRPGRISKKREVPAHIKRPDYADHPEGVAKSEQQAQGKEIKILTKSEIAGVKKASLLARECLNVALAAAKPGMTTDELDRLVHEAAIERKCYPSPLNYYLFPKSCCTSVNEVICHGIPDDRPLEDGDILNVDVTVYHNGYHGDLNETIFIGNVDETAKKLVRVTWESLQKAIESCKPGMLYRDVGNIIQKHVQPHGFSVVKTYCGHGIHSLFHTAPNVPHYAKNKAVGVMKAGHCFTIEPMITEGSFRDDTWPDNWTAVTSDGKRSAQFEQTLLITETGVEILTRRREKNGQPWFMDQLQEA